MRTRQQVSYGLARHLASHQLISHDEITLICDEAEKHQLSLLRYLIRHKQFDAGQLAQRLANDFGLPLLNINAVDIAQLPLELINDQLINTHGVLPLKRRQQRLFIAMADPTRQDILDELSFHTGLTVQSIIVEADKLERIIETITQAANTALFDDLNDETLDNLDINNDENVNEDSIIDAANEAPIVRFVNKVLLDAIKKGASDIHFEPYEKTFRIRFRIDGMLYPIATPPIHLAPRIIARLKVMSNLDISIKRLPQDGQIRMKILPQQTINFRVSTCPMLHAEKVVLRVLATSTLTLGVEALGFESREKHLFLAALKKSQGIVLVVGPTGSGKTVTLYTAIDRLNQVNRNISTAEDPVELPLTGVNQVPINPKAGLNFANALRAFLRQDPDVIMLGEIRDLETADIAIKASQTGHLVLSTLHTKSAVETLIRLINMGIAPYNLSNAINVIIAQRLVRRLCPHCKKTIDLPPVSSLLEIGFTEDELKQLTLYGPSACDQCTHGYQGRIGIYEVLDFRNNIAEALLKGHSATEIACVAQQNGMIPLRRNAIKKVIAGITSLEEINRVM